MGQKVSKSVKKQILNIAFLVLLVAVTLLILCLSNRELDFKSIGDFLVKSDPWFLAIAFVCMLGSVLFEGFALHVICRTMGHKCKLRSSVVYAASDVYYSAITPSASGGQPASAYYMVQDGMNPGAATFSLVFNLIAYTAAMIILCAAAFIISPAMILSFNAFTKLLIILGIIIQLFLLALFAACMYCHRVVLKCGNGLITLLCKMRIIKKENKWRNKLFRAVAKYRGCVRLLKQHRALFAIALLFNVLQRVSQVLITCFVCMAVKSDVAFLDIVAMQIFITIGYYSIPLPGGVGAFEYLYLHIYSLYFDKIFILASMMVARTLSYYMRMALSGVVTLSYHGAIVRRKRRAVLEAEACIESAPHVSDDEISVQNGAIRQETEGGDTKNELLSADKPSDDQDSVTNETVSTEISAGDRTESELYE